MLWVLVCCSVFTHVCVCVCAQPAMAMVIKKRAPLLQRVFIKYAEADTLDTRTSTMSLKELYTLMNDCGQMVGSIFIIVTLWASAVCGICASMLLYCVIL